MSLDVANKEFPEGKQTQLQTEPTETLNRFINDTQIISNKTQTQVSQPSRLQNLRLLSQSDENEIIDSSCELKESISTQILLDKELETTLVNISLKSQEYAENSPPDQIESNSSGPFRNTKFPDAETPWIQKTTDLFNESESPWIVKAKNPFGETPSFQNLTDKFGETPKSSSRQNIETPYSAHRIFEDLRERQGKPELDTESQNDDTEDTNNLETPSKHAKGLSHISGNSKKDYEGTVHPETSNEQTHYEKKPSQSNNSNSDDSSNDLQVPGTAPESTEQHDNDEDHQGSFGPLVNSDDDDDNGDYSSDKKIKNDLQSSSYLNITEDNVQLRNNRDKDAQEHKNASIFRSFQDSKSDAVSDQNARLSSLPISVQVDSSNTNCLDDTSKNDDSIQPAATSSPKSMNLYSENSRYATNNDDNSDQVMKGDPNTENTDKDTGNQFILGENITQEISDVDDDSRKYENTMRVNPNYDEEKYRASIEVKPLSRKRKVLDSTPDERYSKTQRSESLQAGAQESVYGDLETAEATPQFQSTPLLEPIFPTNILREESKNLGDHDIICPNSVWYLDNTRYYPGLILGTLEDGSFEVQFFDSITAVVNGLFPLDIRIKDVIKIGRAHHIIVGLKCLEPENKDIIRCMRGYDTVILRRLRGKGRKQTLVGDEEEFPLSDIVMENEEWYKVTRVLNGQGFLKPGEQLSKRSVKRIRHHNSLSTSSEKRRTTQLIKPHSLNSEGIFSKCLFVITGDCPKEKITQVIKNHGGHIVEDGFSSLMTLLDDEMTSLKFLDKTLTNFKFAALITTKHLRSRKYLETVSLGWPLLSEQYVYDCHSENKLLGNLFPYLLPSGDSTRLGGIPKSSNIEEFNNRWSSGYDLSYQLSNNKILSGKVVILCSAEPSVSKFLFYALGADSVIDIPLKTNSKFISNLSSVFEQKKNHELDYLIYHFEVETIKSFLENTENKKKNTKLSSRRSKLSGLEVQLVDWEWLVQCVISYFSWRSKDIWKFT